MGVCVNLCVNMYMCVNIYTCVCVNIYTCVYVNIYTCVCVCVKAPVTSHHEIANSWKTRTALNLSLHQPENLSAAPTGHFVTMLNETLIQQIKPLTT